MGVGSDGGGELWEDGGEGGLQALSLRQAAPLRPLGVRLEEVAGGELGSLQHAGAPLVHARSKVNELALRRYEDSLVVECDGVGPGFSRASFFSA